MASKSVLGAIFWEERNMEILSQPFCLPFAEMAVCLGFDAIAAIGYWKELAIPSVRKRCEKSFFSIVLEWQFMILDMVRNPIAIPHQILSDNP